MELSKEYELVEFLDFAEENEISFLGSNALIVCNIEEFYLGLKKVFVAIRGRELCLFSFGSVIELVYGD